MVDFGLSKDSLRNIVSLTGEFVGTTDTLTLTNKTISISSNTITATSGALGDLIAHDGTSYVRKAKGTANQAYVTNSGATDTGWGTVAVQGGGTGVATFGAGGVLIGSGTSAITTKANPIGAFVGDSDTQNITGAKTFTSQALKLRNPADTFTTTIINPAVSANRDLTVPTITGSDTIAVLGLPQTHTARPTFSAGLTTSQTQTLNFGSRMVMSEEIDDPTYHEGSNSVHLTSTLGSGGPASLAIYPENPAGIGTSSTVAALYIFNTDYKADYSSYECLQVQAIHSVSEATAARYDIVAFHGSAGGSLHPIFIGMQGFNKMIFNTDGTINMNNIAMTGMTNLTGSTVSFKEISSNVQELKAASGTSCLLRISPNTATVSGTTTRGQLRILNNTGANAEYLLLEARGTNGFILDINKDASGTVRDFNLASAATNVLTITSTPIIKSLKPHQFDDYQDIKVISAPSDPASGYGRVYAKAIDANNDGLFVKLKKAGAVVEVQIA